jgi:hypothetical protein
MRSFWYNYHGGRIEIIFSLVKNGRWWHHSETNQKLGVRFDYPSPENGDELEIGIDDLEEMDKEVRSYLFQKLQLDAPEFELTYS